MKIQTNGDTLRFVEFDLHYGKDYIALHGAATLVNPPSYGPLTGSCAFQSEDVLFCNSDFAISGTLFMSIYFDDEDGDIRDISWDLYTATGGFFGDTGQGTVVAYEEYPNLETQDLHAKWQMGGGTGINSDLTLIEMDLELGRHFVALHGKATRTSGVVPLTGTCVREDDGDYYCVTDYSGSGDATMLLRPTGATAIMAMRSYNATGAENGRATGNLIELK